MKTARLKQRLAQAFCLAIVLLFLWHLTPQEWATIWQMMGKAADAVRRKL